MSVNTTYEPIRVNISSEFAGRSGKFVYLTWEAETRVSAIKVELVTDTTDDSGNQVRQLVSEITFTYSRLSNILTLDSAFDFTPYQDSGHYLWVTRVTPITQTESFEAGRFVREDELELALDKLIYIAQELKADDY